MHILLTNDDGIHAPGLLCLARALKDRHRLTVVAPDRERSATSHSLTLDRPLTARAVTSPAGLEDVRMFSVNGTPVDCVHIGTDPLADAPVDLLVSGINNGSNMGADVSYSGTVHAALEGAMNGIPSIALSQVIAASDQKTDAEERYIQGARMAAQLIDMLPLRMLDGIIFNINFPEKVVDDDHPIRICPQGISVYDTSFQRMNDPFGREFYWVYASENEMAYNEEHRTDVYWSSRGYVTITPMHWNITATDRFEETIGAFGDVRFHG